jgi:hypothetical protein
MDNDTLYGSIAFLAGLGGLAAFIRFLVTQQRTLNAVPPEDRLLRPGRVWLQLIPVFGLIYQFFVTARIAGSLRKERISRLSDSLMTEHSGPATLSTNRPTLGIGLSFCITNLGFSIANFFNAFLTVDPRRGDTAVIAIVSLSFIFFALGALTCWIIYWISLARSRRRILAAI